MAQSPMERDEHGSAAELHLQRVIETASDAHVAVDDNGLVTEWNRAAASTFGWSRAEALGRRLQDLIVPTELAFAAMAAHDLRSPLTIISMYAELMSEELEEGTLDAALAGDQLHRIRRAADRGVALIDDLLAFASIGRESLEIGSVDLTLLTQAVAAEHQASSDRPVHVTVEALPEVEGSLPLLHQLISNLIGNAVKYAPPDREVAIAVDTEPARSPDRVTVRITDNGDPIAPGDRERLFGMFQRGDHRELPGSGVGLAICQRVAEAHGGRVLLDPDYAEGNRFCIELAAHPPGQA